MKKIVLYGAGGLGRELVRLIRLINQRETVLELRGFVVDKEYYHPDQYVDGYPVLGDREWLVAHKSETYCVCAIGEPKARASVQTDLQAQGVRFTSLIAPDVEIPATSTVGAGSIIQSHTVISVGVHIGDGVLINFDGFLGHDAVVDEYACLMSRCSLNGFTHVGKRVYMGGLAYILPHVVVGDDATVAAGSVVFHRVKPGTHVLGNPAKRITL